MADFRRACPAESDAQPQRTEADAALLESARRVSENVSRIDAATVRLKDPSLSLEGYQKETREATAATSAAQAAAKQLMEAEAKPVRRFEWRRRAAEQATQRLQQVLLQASERQITCAVRAHLSVRTGAHQRVRAALERQIALACPEAREARLDHLTEDALQQFVQEATVGKRGGLAKSAGVLREVERDVAQLREMMVQFALIVEAQKESVGAAGRAVETANISVQDAEDQLKLAKESNTMYQRAKWVVIIVLLVVLFIFCGGFGSLPEWLSFARRENANQVRAEMFDTPTSFLENAVDKVSEDEDEPEGPPEGRSTVAAEGWSNHRVPCRDCQRLHA